jgi:phage terminase small subunit
LKPIGRKLPSDMAAGKLTPNQSRFVHEYLIDLNATQAAIRAGYSKRGANVQGPTLLANPSIKAAIEAAIGKRDQRTEVKADRVIAELALLAFSNVQNFETDDHGRVVLASKDIPDDVWRSVSSMKTKITTDKSGNVYRDVELRLWSKTEALKMLGQHLAMFVERMRIEDPNGELAKLLGVKPEAMPE